MRAKKNIYASYLFIVVNILINLLIVRFTVNHYGEEVYAFVVLAFAFMTYVDTFNLGIFISNRTQIPMGSHHVNVYTVSSFKLLSKISFGLLIVNLALYFGFGNELVRLITSESNPEILDMGKNLIFIGVLYSLLKIPLALVLSAFAGQDFVNIEKNYNILQQLVKFISLIIAIQMELSAFYYLLSFTVLGLLVLILANIHYYLKFIKVKRQTYLRFSKKLSSAFILKKSFKFFIFTFASVIVWSTDHLLVSIFFTPKLVSDYHINFSIYNAGFLFITAISGALIANYGNLIRDKEFDTLSFRLNLSLYTTSLISLCIGFGGFLFAKEIISLWVGAEHFISPSLLIAFAFFGVTIGISSVLNTIISLFAGTKVIMGMTLAEAVLNLSFSVILLKLIGVEGIAYATGIAAIISIVIPGWKICSREFKDKIHLEKRMILIQVLLCTIFSYFSFNFSLDLVGKIMLFLFYALTAFLLTYIYRKDFILSYIKMIKK